MLLPLLLNNLLTAGEAAETPRVVSGLGNYSRKYAYGVRDRKKKLPVEVVAALEVAVEADGEDFVAALDALEAEMRAAVQRNRGLVERFAYQELVAAVEAEQVRLRAIEIAALERHLNERKRQKELIDAEAVELLELLSILDSA